MDRCAKIVNRLVVELQDHSVLGGQTLVIQERNADEVEVFLNIIQDEVEVALLCNFLFVS